ncbi:MAG: hypothetical protein ACOC9Y_07695, partial [Chloroflexota bacterium]
MVEDLSQKEFYVIHSERRDLDFNTSTRPIYFNQGRAQPPIILLWAEGSYDQNRQILHDLNEADEELQT